MPAAVFDLERAPRFAGQRFHDQFLNRSRVLPEEHEMRVLGPQHVAQRERQQCLGRLPALRGPLPEEVAELLGRVWVAFGVVEHAGDGLRGERLAGGVETVDEKGREGGRPDRAQLDRLRAAPKRFVLVVEQSLHDVPPAAEVDVGDLRLLLEHRPHQVRQQGVDLDHLLELVHNERGPALSAARQLTGEAQEPLQGGVDVRRALAGAEAERVRAVLRVDRHRRLDLETAERSEGGLFDALQGRRDLLEDGAGEGGGQPLLGRRGHQIHLSHQHAVRTHRLDRAPGERRLSQPAPGDDHDVLSVANVARELGALALPVREGLVERKRSEVKRIACKAIHTVVHYTSLYGQGEKRQTRPAFIYITVLYILVYKHPRPESDVLAYKFMVR